MMFPWIARFALVLLAGKAVDRLVQHPRIAPLAQSRKGRLAMLALGWGMRRHARTRVAGHAVGHVARRLRPRV